MTRVVVTRQSACPLRIWTVEHYRDDGSCRCDDPAAHVMRTWGYCWDATAGRWKA